MKLSITLALLSAALIASASSTTPKNTGMFDVNGFDQNWTVSIDGGVPTVVGVPSYGGYYNGAPFTSASAWIGLQGVPTSTYTYTTSFFVEAGDLAHYRLAGVFSSDNASHLMLNGVDTGVNAPYGNGGSVPGDSYLQPFTFDLHSGFVAGLNTISFVVTNDAGSSYGGWANPDPNGLRAEFSPMSSVPGPGSVLAFAVGAAGALRRRRRG